MVPKVKKEKIYLIFDKDKFYKRKLEKQHFEIMEYISKCEYIFNNVRNGKKSHIKRLIKVMNDLKKLMVLHFEIESKLLELLSKSTEDDIQKSIVQFNISFKPFLESSNSFFERCCDYNRFNELSEEEQDSLINLRYKEFKVFSKKVNFRLVFEESILFSKI